MVFFYRKNIFDKIVDIFRGTQQRMIWELGLEFLRVYDGKFNYEEGYTVRSFVFLNLNLNIYDNLVCNVFSKKGLVFNS